MTTTTDVEAEIIRLHFAEHWRVGTIAGQLGVHPDVVRRVLGIGDSRPSGVPRPRLCDPFRDFIAQTLARYPRLRATRLYDMLRERGYKGAARTLRTYVVPIRPAPRREVYLRTEPLVGEQAQVDWAHAGTVSVAGGVRALWLFVMVLSYSRALWGQFVLDLSVHSLCRSLVRAARALAGPRDSGSSTIPRPWCSSAVGTRCGFTRCCSICARRCACNRDSAPSDGPSTRVGSSARAVTCATASSPAE